MNSSSLGAVFDDDGSHCPDSLCQSAESFEVHSPGVVVFFSEGKCFASASAGRTVGFFQRLGDELSAAYIAMACDAQGWVCDK